MVAALALLTVVAATAAAGTGPPAVHAAGPPAAQSDPVEANVGLMPDFSVRALDTATVAVEPRVWNNGPADATSVVLTVTIPSGTRIARGDLGLTDGPARGPFEPCAIDTAGTTATCQLGSALPSGSSALAHLLVEQAGLPAGQPVTATVSVTSATTDPDPSDNTTTATFAFGDGANLGIDRTGSGVIAASLADVSARVSNTGFRTATDVVVAFTVPAGVTVRHAEVHPMSGDVRPPFGPCAPEPGGTRHACTVGAMEPGGLIGVRMELVNTGLAAGSTVSVLIEVGSAVVDPEPAGNIASVAVTFPGAPVGPGQTDLAVGGELMAMGPSVALGRASVSNSTDRPATAVTVTVTAPAGTTITRAHNTEAPSSGTCDLAGDGRTASCPIGELGAEDWSPMQFVIANTGLPAGSTITVGVAVTAAEPDANPSDDTTSLTVTFPGGPVDVDSVDVALGAAGETEPGPHPAVVEVGLFAWNGGPAAAGGVRVALTVPDGAAVAWRGPVPYEGPSGHTPTHVVCETGSAGSRLTCTADGDLSAGDVALLPLQVLNVGLPAGSTVTLEATITTAEVDNDPENDTVRVPVTFAGGALPAGGNDVGIAGPPRTWQDPNRGIVAADWSITTVGTVPPGTLTAVALLADGLDVLSARIESSSGSAPCTVTEAAITCTLSWPLPPAGAGHVFVAASYADATTPVALHGELFVAGDAPDPDPTNNHAAFDLGTATAPPPQPRPPSGPPSNPTDGSSASTPGSGTTMPFTGADSATLLAFAVALIAAGTALALSARRLAAARTPIARDANP